MKQSKIIDLYNSLEPLADNIELSEKEQWDLYQLRKAIRPHFEFQLERETAIRNKFEKFVDDNGEIHGKEAEDLINAINELNNMEVDFNPDKPKIRLVKGISFTLAEKLDEFIEFISC